MSTELATVANNAAAINKAFGYKGKSKPSIPILKINGADEEEGVSAPKGTYVYEDGDRILYTSEVSIRSFTKAYQYRVFNLADASKNDMSIIANDFKAEFRSLSGRLACGKMNKKKYISLGDNVTAVQKSLQESVKCKLLIFGLVSGKFTDADTKQEVIVEDALFYWITPQSGFMPLDRAITGLEKERRAVPLTYINLRLKKEKTGQVTYFVPVVEVTTNTAPLNIERDGGYLKQITKFIEDTNEFVNSRYNEATRGRQEDANFAEVGKTIEGKSSFYNDPLNDL